MGHDKDSILTKGISHDSFRENTYAEWLLADDMHEVHAGDAGIAHGVAHALGTAGVAGAVAAFTASVNASAAWGAKK